MPSDVFTPWRSLISTMSQVQDGYQSCLPPHCRMEPEVSAFQHADSSRSLISIQSLVLGAGRMLSSLHRLRTTCG